MINLTLRKNSGIPLTFNQMDDNFIFLDNLLNGLTDRVAILENNWIITANTPTPIATTSTLGQIIVGSGLVVSPTGVLSATSTSTSASYTFSTGLTELHNIITLNPTSPSALGGVKVGTGLTSAIDGTLSVTNPFVPYVLPTASTTVEGGVKVDGTTIISNNGVISAIDVDLSYTLTPATTSVLGGIIAGSGLSVTSNGTLSVTDPFVPYVLPTASTTVEGGVKVDGTTITITNGTISATQPAAVIPYTLPPATLTELGGIKVGTGLNVTVDGTISAVIDTDTIAIASTSTAGIVKVDGTSITINGSGVISATAATPYTLPVSTPTILGGVKAGSGLTVDGTGLLSVVFPTDVDQILTAGTGISIVGNTISSTITPYTLTNASTTTLGGVKVDGTSITINGSGIISATPATPYTLPTATTSTPGGVIVGTGLTISSGILSATPATPYTLPTATASVLGGIMVGSGLSISSGVLSATATNYTLPTASTTVLGGVKVDGTTVTINGSGVISATGGSGTGVTSLTVSTVPTTGALVSGILVGTSVGSVTEGTITPATATLNAAGTIYIELDNALRSIANLSSTGMISAGSGTTVSRIMIGGGQTATGTVSGVTNSASSPASGTIIVYDGDGIGNNPTFDLKAVLQGTTVPIWNKLAVNGYGQVTNTTPVTASDITALVPTYTLPTATTLALGGVKVDGTSITINGSGVISASGSSSYTLPTATTTLLGGVKIDGSTITISNGVISAASGSTYTLPTASASTLGGVKVGAGLSISSGTLSTTALIYSAGAGITINGSGVISSTVSPGPTYTFSTGLANSSNTITLDTASTSVLGGVKVDGTSITINGSGVISATGSGGGSSYTLPIATSSSLGGVEVGTSLSINGTTGALDLVASGVTAGTYGSATQIPVVTVNDKGVVTGVTVANPSAIPTPNHIAYTYDSKLRIATETDTFPDSSVQTITYAYDSHSNVSSITTVYNGVTTVESFTYDSKFNVTSITIS